MKTQLIMFNTPVIVSYDNRDWQKIIAGIEGLPSINWNGLEEEFGWIDVEKLANETYPEAKEGCDYDEGGTYFAFIEGFKKAQSLNEKKFSLEEVKRYHNTMCLHGNIKGEEYLQSLQQPKVFNIEVEMEEYVLGSYGLSDGEPSLGERIKITDNSIKILRKL